MPSKPDCFRSFHSNIFQKGIVTLTVPLFWKFCDSLDISKYSRLVCYLEPEVTDLLCVTHWFPVKQYSHRLDVKLQ